MIGDYKYDLLMKYFKNLKGNKVILTYDDIAFINKYPDIVQDNAVTAENSYNAATLLRTSISDDVKILSEPCIVIKS